MRTGASGTHLPDPAPAAGKRIAVVAARFNGDVTAELLEGCRAGLTEFGVSTDDVDIYLVPGAWELPQTARRVVALGQHDAVIALGCVIRGETAHFDYVAGEASQGLGAVARNSDVPVVFGVLTTDTMEQAWARASRDGDDKGRELALSALHMIELYDGLKAP